MTFTAEGIVMILTAVGLLVPVIATQIVNVMNARRIRQEIAAVATKQALIAETVAKVETNVNSKASIAEGRELTLKRENELLREQLTDAKTAAGLLAQAAATSPKIVQAGTITNGKPAEDSLAKIEDHTEKIQSNTARTEATVKKLDDKS